MFLGVILLTKWFKYFISLNKKTVLIKFHLLDKKILASKNNLNYITIKEK